MIKQRQRTDCQHQVGVIKRCRTSKRKQPTTTVHDLPEDVMLLIFKKLGVVELLINVQKVCSLWRTLAKDPQLYSSLNFLGIENYVPSKFGTPTRGAPLFKKLAKEAVDRSCGQIVSLAVDCYSSDYPRGHTDFLGYVSYSTTFSLKSLRIGPDLSVSEYKLSRFFEQEHQLEEVDLYCFEFPNSLTETVSRSCQKLTSFRVCTYGNGMGQSTFEKSACSIAGNIPQLRRLGLMGLIPTEKGLQTIVNGCPNLEYLDLRKCSTLKASIRIIKRCTARIRNVLLPEQSPFRYNEHAVLKSNFRQLWKWNHGVGGVCAT